MVERFPMSSGTVILPFSNLTGRAIAQKIAPEAKIPTRDIPYMISIQPKTPIERPGPGPVHFPKPSEEPEPVKPAPVDVHTPLPPWGPFPFLFPGYGTIPVKEGEPGIPSLGYGDPDITPQPDTIIQLAPWVGPTPEPIIGPGVTPEQVQLYEETTGAQVQEFGLAGFKFPDILGGLGRVLLIAGAAIAGVYILGKFLGRSQK